MVFGNIVDSQRGENDRENVVDEQFVTVIFLARDCDNAMNWVIGLILTWIEHTRWGYHDYEMYTDKYEYG